jgi:hypothetical protein
MRNSLGVTLITCADIKQKGNKKMENEKTNQSEKFKIQDYREKGRTKIICVRLTETLAKQIRDLAEKESISISKLAVQMIKYCLERYEE